MHDILSEKITQQTKRVDQWSELIEALSNRRSEDPFPHLAQTLLQKGICLSHHALKWLCASGKYAKIGRKPF